MRPAAAEVLLQRPPDLGLARARIRVEQRLRGDGDARDAVAALGRLLGDERALERGQPPARGEAFDGGDLAPGERADRSGAALHGAAVAEHRARATLLEAAAVLRAGEAELVAQHPQERRRLVGVDLPRLAVHLELHARSSRTNSMPTSPSRMKIKIEAKPMRWLWNASVNQRTVNEPIHATDVPESE